MKSSKLILLVFFLTTLVSCIPRTNTATSSIGAGSTYTDLLLMQKLAEGFSNNGSGNNCGGCNSCCCNTCNSASQDQTCSSFVFVTDEQGEPLADVDVIILKSNNKYLTDEFGGVIINDLSNATYAIAASKTGYVLKSPLHPSLRVKNLLCPVLNIVMGKTDVVPTTCSPLFIVQDEFGTPIVDAEISINNNTYKTTVDGVLIPDLEEKEYFYGVTATDYDTVVNESYDNSNLTCLEKIIVMQKKHVACDPSFSIKYSGTLVDLQSLSITFTLDGAVQTITTGANGAITVQGMDLAAGQHNYSINYKSGSDTYSKTGSFSVLQDTCLTTVSIDVDKELPAVCSPTFTIVDETNPTVPFILSEHCNSANLGESCRLMADFDTNGSQNEFYPAAATGTFKPVNLEKRIYKYDLYVQNSYFDQMGLVYDNSDGSCPSQTIVIKPAICNVFIVGPRYGAIGAVAGNAKLVFDLDPPRFNGSITVTAHKNVPNGEVQGTCASSPGGEPGCNLDLPIGTYCFDFEDLATGYKFYNDPKKETYCFPFDKAGCTYSKTSGTKMDIWPSELPQVNIKVLSGNNPVNNALVSIAVTKSPYLDAMLFGGSFGSLTDVTGFATPRIAPGSYSYSVSIPGLGLDAPITKTGFSFEVPKSNDSITLPPVVFDYLPTVTISVKKRGPGGVGLEPLSGASVDTKAGWDLGGAVVNTDANGVVFGLAAPNKQYNLSVSCNDCQLDGKHYVSQNINITVSNTDVTVPTVVLELQQ